MPCLGSRKKSTLSNNGLEKIHPDDIKLEQDYLELKSKNLENLNLISKQTAEIESLKNQLERPDEYNQALADLCKKKELLEKGKEEFWKLKETLESIQQQDDPAQLMAKKDEILKEKESELEAIRQQWENERAELVKPALEQVTGQLEELKETNKVVMERLSEKEEELAELHAQFNKRDRSPKSKNSKDQEQQKRLNRLTTDLESDRMLMQKLDELNKQLELQKQKHETILKSHAIAIAEKDKKLQALKKNHDMAIIGLESLQTEKQNKLQLKYDKDISLLNQRLKQAENQAKTTVDDEVSRILYEFEEYEHNHSLEVANLHQEHQNEISVMKLGQQSELQLLSDKNIVTPKLRKTGGPSSKFKWPAPNLTQPVDLSPRNPKEIHIYTSSISANPKLKQEENELIESLTAYNLEYKLIDVAKSEIALQHMRKQNSKSRTLPQIFLGGCYKCTFEEFIQAKEDGILLQFLESKKI